MSVSVNTTDHLKLRGIGGWLILVAIGQIISPLWVLKNIFEMFEPSYDLVWNRYPLAAQGELTLYVAWMFLLFYCAYSFFDKNRRFPTLCIWTLWLAMAVTLVDTVWVASQMPVPFGKVVTSVTGDIIRQFVIAVVWTAYLLKSVRVKNTFTNY